MRIFIWHGYLLAGTGSNIFVRELARQWGNAGHDVTVFSQEAHPDRYDLCGAATVRPDVGGMLPVFVILATFVLAWRGVKWVTLRPFGLYQPAPPK